MPESPTRPASRREFLAAGAVTATAASAAEAPAPLPTVSFGAHKITRLIVGSNPLYGYAHFNTLLGRMMKDWMTDEKRIEVLRNAEAAGVSTWQLHYSPQTIEDLKRYRAAGGRMNLLLLGMGAVMTDPKLIPEVAKHGFLGIAHHGNMTDDRFAAGQMNLVREWLKRVRDAGVRVGLSTHNPSVIDHIEGQDWDIDYYMTCLYRVSRTREDARRQFGEAPVGEIYMEKDPERMMKMIRQTKRQCLAFKILAAGRTINTPEQVENSFRYAVTNIKPGDAVIVGTFPRYKDEMRENAALVRRFSGQPS